MALNKLDEGLLKRKVENAKYCKGILQMKLFYLSNLIWFLIKLFE